MWFWLFVWISTSDWISDDVISIFGMEKLFFFSENLTGTSDWRRRLWDRKHEGFMIPLEIIFYIVGESKHLLYRSLWQFRCFRRRFGLDSTFLGHAIETKSTVLVTFQTFSVTEKWLKLLKVFQWCVLHSPLSLWICLFWLDCPIIRVR